VVQCPFTATTQTHIQDKLFDERNEAISKASNPKTKKTRSDIVKHVGSDVLELLLDGLAATNVALRAEERQAVSHLPEEGGALQHCDCWWPASDHLGHDLPDRVQATLGVLVAEAVEVLVGFEL
jgi:hypothetical protein